MADTADDLRRTPLHELHRALGGRMVAFAGYSMPVQYEGILAEHRWTRASAGLFDVSHMGQRVLSGPGQDAVADALESITPGSFRNLAPGRMRYTLLLADTGGILDDLMVTRPAGGGDGQLMLVFNAARKEIDDAYFGERLPGTFALEALDDRALLALQGPKAVDALARHCPEAAGLTFMSATEARFDDAECLVSRSGYTGEDGFEISVRAEDAVRVARTLLDEPEVKPVGLGARDSLRLEAGLPLYGHDLDETTSPVEAGLAFAIAKARRETGGFPGADRILRELAEGPARLRVGIRPAGRAPVREGADILGLGDTRIGEVTSGGFGPTVEAPVAMGYVAAPYAAPGTDVQVSGRRGPEPATVAALPFVPPRYVR
ncbi:glycine cleavage system aminomethyltransferase GcvT [Propylenella binzhouense]|uniref:aminomethyltransferase n=1 Tax=Propylenella binzhouense TaxID=2555902 RepID=A0A964T627_9HYPH|nr:glycine cleavage system aminomethyltransferase GcvT [Propylenella binzhouense]MYZ48572.1 glycine cleavage system aminomethyltransferase GcvT [Propylenella binzhouense]